MPPQKSTILSAIGPQKPVPTPELWGFPGYLTPTEQKALEELRVGVVKEKLFAPNNVMPDHHLLRFLRARDFNLQKTLDMLKNDLEWRKAFEGQTLKPADFPTVLPFLQKGALYRAGYDKDGRPVIVAKLSELYPKEVADIQELPRIWVAYVHYISQECEEMGVTDYTVIGDLSGFSASKNFSLAFTKVLIEILQNYYPERLGYALIVNAPMMFRALWNMIVPFLEERTQKKVHVLGGGYKLLKEYIPDDQLEQRFGGAHAPYPIPDHVTSQILKEGVTVNTGYFDGLDAPIDEPLSPEASSDSASKMKKTASSRRLDRVRGMLARFDTMSRVRAMPEMVKAVEVPKSAPRVTIFGATGRTGIEVVRRALKAGFDVAAFVRMDGHGVPPALLKLNQEVGNDHLQIVVGSITDPTDLDRAIETSDVVVSCLGGERSLTTSADWIVEATSKMMDAMERNGTKRFVIVTAGHSKRMSKGWYDSNASITDNGARHVYWSTLYSHLAQVEKLVEQAHQRGVVDYTFVRPAQLDDGTDDAYLVEEAAFFCGQGGVLPRMALARFIVDECVVQSRHSNKGVALAGRG